jgi:predicted nucleotidyltransferase
MHAAIQGRVDQLQTICRSRHVRCLWLFGSGTGPAFDPETSDLDFAVEFLPLAPGDRAEAYFGLLADLERAFERSVDLVELTAIRNPYFREALEEERVVLYEAA